jgi:DNA invertase Pin-like site-specific DNA recombinase
MNGSTKIQPTHLKRQAVVYLRQSTPQQILTNRESALNQRNLRVRLYALGWRKDQILLIDVDQGQPGTQTIGREEFQGLVADVSLLRVGIIIGCEVARLFRNERGDD